MRSAVLFLRSLHPTKCPQIFCRVCTPSSNKEGNWSWIPNSIRTKRKSPTKFVPNVEGNFFTNWSQKRTENDSMVQWMRASSDGILFVSTSRTWFGRHSLDQNYRCSSHSVVRLGRCRGSLDDLHSSWDLNLTWIRRRHFLHRYVALYCPTSFHSLSTGKLRFYEWFFAIILFCSISH